MIYIKICSRCCWGTTNLCASQLSTSNEISLSSRNHVDKVLRSSARSLDSVDKTDAELLLHSWAHTYAQETPARSWCVMGPFRGRALIALLTGMCAWNCGAGY